MKWILLVILLSFQGGTAPTSVTITFDSEAACTAASKQIRTANPGFEVYKGAAFTFCFRSK